MKYSYNGKSVIIYGGAFNPPTLAHQAILKACLMRASDINADVWLMPSGTRPDKSINLDTQLRIDLIKALCKDTEGAERVEIEKHEINNTVPTETIDTWRYLQNRYPGINFIWVFGADSINTMKQWAGGYRLWGELSMLVIPRTGVELSSLPPKAEVFEVDTPNISSTMVRQGIESGEDISSLVSYSVLKIILQKYPQA